MKIGAQLYTLREFCKDEAGIDESFAKVAAIGYKYIQVSGLANIGAENMRRIADKHGLTIILTHSPAARVLNDTDALIEEHKIMGAGYIGIGSMPDEYRGDLAAFIRDFTAAAKKIKAAGLQFMYHNHDFEFVKLDGKLMIDHIVDEFDADTLGFVLDVFWVQAGGGDPAWWLRKLKGRVNTIHFKDFGILNDERAMMPVLEGNLNWPEIFAACKDAGVDYAFIEQDDCNGVCPFECLKTSFDNLHAIGLC